MANILLQVNREVGEAEMTGAELVEEGNAIGKAEGR